METTILNRLSQLERSNRRLKIGLAILGAGGLAAFFAGAAAGPSSPITTSELRLVDTDGRTRAHIGSDREGTFFLLHDEAGKPRLSLAAQRSAAFMTIRDENGKVRAVISYDEQGPAVRLKDKEGNPLANILIDDKGPVLQLRDDTGHARFLSPLQDDVATPRPPEERREERRP
jgi:hypothetical protein